MVFLKLGKSKGDATFHQAAYDQYLLRDSLHDHLTDIPWQDIFKLGALVGATEYCEWIQIEIDVDTPHPKSQVKPNSSPWFSAACPRKAIACRNPFFSLCQQNKSLHQNEVQMH